MLHVWRTRVSKLDERVLSTHSRLKAEKRVSTSPGLLYQVPPVIARLAQRLTPQDQLEVHKELRPERKRCG